ncbi:hypothetical protein CGRA01v4_11531 [Colletotrichum graminicola]|nr:hypothetical protein CGRA01v4_11531 [Colletotrichum graminicola]
MYLSRQVNMMLGTLSWRRASPPSPHSSSVGSRPPPLAPSNVPAYYLRILLNIRRDKSSQSINRKTGLTA